MWKPNQLRYSKARREGCATLRRATPSLSSMRRPATFALVFVVGLLVMYNPGKADSQNLEGSWRGVGAFSFMWGTKEHARCRADYSRNSETSYAVKAVCTTASATATQTAVLRKVGENRYRGNFHNSQYNVSGTISVVIRGTKQDVTLTSDGASAALTLMRLPTASVVASP